MIMLAAATPWEIIGATIGYVLGGVIFVALVAKAVGG